MIQYRQNEKYFGRRAACGRAVCGKRGSRMEKISRKNWALIWVLGMAGQICWNIENSWFNTFVYRKIAPDPSIVAWMVGVSAVTALWSASRGIYGLLTGLNAVYGVSENRGYIYTRSISVVYTFVFILILLLTLVLHVFGNSIINLMRQVDNPVVIFFTDLIDLRFFLLLFLQSLVFTLMFMVLPNKRRSRFMESLPGGVLSSLGWLVFSDIYSIYVENFSKYSTIYGSVYGIAITMLWLYCCMSILFYGGALNRYLMDK